MNGTPNTLVPAASRRRRAVALGVIAAASLAVSPTVKAQVLEIKLGHVGNPGSLFQLSADEFARRANARLAGKAKVTVFGSSQLGGDKEMIQKLKLGTLDLALPSTVMTSEADLFGVFEMPYLVSDRKHMARIEREIVWPSLVPAAKAKGLEIVAVWENGYRHITNNVRPIARPADLKGIKLRTPNGKWRVRMFQDYGASPSPMKFSELFTALKTGVMDGQENPFTQIWSAKLHEVQKYLSLTGHVYTPAYLTAGARKWAALPPEVREALAATAKEVQSFVYETAAREDDALLSRLKTAGIVVNEVDKTAFVEGSRRVYDDFGKEVAGAKTLIERAIALR